MANLTVDPTEVRVVKFFEQLPDGPAAEAIDAGQIVRLDPTTGYYTLANGTVAGEADVMGMSITTANVANLTISVVRRAIVNLDAAAVSGLTINDPIYLSDTDGTLADTAGSVEVVVGRIVPGFASVDPDMLLSVEL